MGGRTHPGNDQSDEKQHRVFGVHPRRLTSVWSRGAPLCQPLLFVVSGSLVPNTTIPLYPRATFYCDRVRVVRRPDVRRRRRWKRGISVRPGRFAVIRQLARNVDTGDLGDGLRERSLEVDIFDADILDVDIRFDGPQLFQLASLSVDHPPRARVDAQSQEDDEPDGTVEDRETQVVPRRRDPAPQLRDGQLRIRPGQPARACTYHGGTVDPAAGPAPDKEVDKSRDKRQSVAEQKVFPFLLSQLIGVVFTEEGEIDVTGHREGP